VTAHHRGGASQRRLSDPSTSRAVLIEAHAYTRTGARARDYLDDRPSVEAGCRRLAQLLKQPAVWGLPEENCVLVSQPTREDMLHAVKEAAAATTDTLLVYYAGHGLLYPFSDDLHLAVPQTTKDRSYTAVKYEDLREILLEATQVRRKVVVLDCCFSGTALRGALSADDAATVHLADVWGTSLLAASHATKQAIAPPGEAYPAFTGELINLLEQGDPNKPELLSMADIFDRLDQQLLSKNRPRPQQLNRDHGAHICIARNKAPSTTTSNSEDATGQVREMASGRNPDRPMRPDYEGGPVGDLPPLLARAVELACRIENHDKGYETLRGIAETVASTAPEASLHVVNRLPDDEQCVGLLILAHEMSDSSRARQLIQRAQQLDAQIIQKHPFYPWYCLYMASSLTKHIPEQALPWLDRTEQLLHNSRSVAEGMIVEIFSLANLLQVTDPQRASRFMARIEQIASPSNLGRFAETGRAADPENAERLIALAAERARRVPSPIKRRRELQRVAESVAAFDFVRAEEIARALGPEDRLEVWLGALRRATEDSIPLLLGAAQRIALLTVPQEVLSPRGPLRLFGLRRHTVSRLDPDRVEKVVVALASFDVERAERLTQQIDSRKKRAEALINMAAAAPRAELTRVRSWLRTAYAAALWSTEAGEWEQARLMGKIADRAAAIDFDLARQAATNIEKSDWRAWLPKGVVDLSADIVATDPLLAEKMLDWVCLQPQLHDGIRCEVAASYIATLVAWGDGHDRRSYRLIRSLQEVMESLPPGISIHVRRFPTSGALASGILRQLLEQYEDGPRRNAILKAIAQAHLPANIDQALEITDCLTDVEARDYMLSRIAVTMAESVI
jgi:hypothetical protein